MLMAKEIIFYTWLHNTKFATKYLEDRMEHFYPDVKDLIGEIIADLRIVVDRCLYGERDWWNRLVPEGTKKYAEDHSREIESSDLFEKRLYFISEGHLLEIISNLYNKFFHKVMIGQFDDRKAFEKNFSIFKKKRDEHLHFIPVNLDPEEMKILYDLHHKIHPVRESLQDTK